MPWRTSSEMGGAHRQIRDHRTALGTDQEWAHELATVGHRSGDRGDIQRRGLAVLADAHAPGVVGIPVRFARADAGDVLRGRQGQPSDALARHIQGVGPADPDGAGVGRQHAGAEAPADPIGHQREINVRRNLDRFGEIVGAGRGMVAQHRFALGHGHVALAPHLLAGNHQAVLQRAQRGEDLERRARRLLGDRGVVDQGLARMLEQFLVAVGDIGELEGRGRGQGEDATGAAVDQAHAGATLADRVGRAHAIGVASGSSFGGEVDVALQAVLGEHLQFHVDLGQQIGARQRLGVAQGDEAVRRARADAAAGLAAQQIVVARFQAAGPAQAF